MVLQFIAPELTQTTPETANQGWELTGVKGPHHGVKGPIGSERP